jgi:hypothetical protein
MADDRLLVAADDRLAIVVMDRLVEVVLGFRYHGKEVELVAEETLAEDFAADGAEGNTGEGKGRSDTLEVWADHFGTCEETGSLTAAEVTEESTAVAE